uniref:ARAD1A14146p n=1 Tax=Blastobotrys adeninivorans TaxID=409370 RepID=A0A060T3A4_BLAAD
MLDIEKGSQFVREFAWKDVTVSVPSSEGEKVLLNSVNGRVRAGEMLAIMGSSGSGKTTLLDYLSRRSTKGKQLGEVTIDKIALDNSVLREYSVYVEQEDTLIGSLTVRETMNFSARLSQVPKDGLKQKIAELLAFFGLSSNADTKVGTPIIKGLSGGQKRRLSVASQLITDPSILFLDEPTSGLDSFASYQVIKSIREIAKARNMIVICTIHQPSMKTFQLFDKLMVLSKGNVLYNDRVDKVSDYFSHLGHPVSPHENVADHILEVTNVDFDNTSQGGDTIQKLSAAWRQHELETQTTPLESTRTNSEESLIDTAVKESKRNQISVFTSQVFYLCRRQLIKARRDVFAYGVRMIMYLGLAILMGTVWLRFKQEEKYVQPYVNAIFFGSAFMSFMAVAYIPAFLEDHSAFVRESQNGLYGPGPFLVSNFVIGVPFLFLIALMFLIVTFWLIHFTATGPVFGKFLLWLFLDLLAAESLVVLISLMVPQFVGALALVAFANGLWMSVDGFLVAPNVLNVFWKYTFHQFDYQRYVFEGLMAAQFKGTNFECHEQCRYSLGNSSSSGQEILESYGYGNIPEGKWVGILISIIAAMRILAYLWLKLKNYISN